MCIRDSYLCFLGFYNANPGPVAKDDTFTLLDRRGSKPKKFDPSISREDYVYEGYQNSLMRVREYVLSISNLVTSLPGLRGIQLLVQAVNLSIYHTGM